MYSTLTRIDSTKNLPQTENAISIIPDTHILQYSIHLGIASTSNSSLQVAEAWKALLTDTELSPVDMHPVLWNWSRNGFLPEVSYKKDENKKITLVPNVK